MGILCSIKPLLCTVYHHSVSCRWEQAPITLCLIIISSCLFDKSRHPWNLFTLPSSCSEFIRDIISHECCYHHHHGPFRLASSSSVHGCCFIIRRRATAHKCHLCLVTNIIMSLTWAVMIVFYYHPAWFIGCQCYIAATTAAKLFTLSSPIPLNEWLWTYLI